MSERTTKSKEYVRRKYKDNLFKAAFAMPSVIVYTMVMVVPIFFSIYYSMLKWDGVGKKKFVGLKNYIELLMSNNYKIITVNTLILVACSLLITTTIALVTAYLIYRSRIGFKIFRGAVFMPTLLSSVIIGLIFAILLNADMGPVNQILKAVGLEKMARPWLGDPKSVLPAVIIPQIWQNIGYYTIIFLAGMQSIPTEILESARMDGANSFVLFHKMVVPMISNIMEIIIILVVTSSLKSFGYSWTMTKGGPGVKSSFFTVYMYTKAFMESDFGSSSAVSFNILLYALLFTGLFKLVTGRMRRIHE